VIGPALVSRPGPPPQKGLRHGDHAIVVHGRRRPRATSGPAIPASKHLNSGWVPTFTIVAVCPRIASRPVPKRSTRKSAPFSLARHDDVLGVVEQTNARVAIGQSVVVLASSASD